MIIKRNTEPTNTEFFTRVVPFIPWIFWGGVIFQLISAITEAFGVYQFGSAVGAPTLVIAFFTLLIVAGWEFLIRASVQYVSKTAMKKVRGEIKLENPELILITIALLIGAPLIYYSYSVSKENAHMTFEVMMPDRDTMVVANIQHGKQSELSNIESDYISRKSEIEKRYREKESAARGIYSADKATHNTNIQEWRDKEKKYNKKYTSYINKEKDKLNESYRVYKDEVKNITEAKSEELASLSQWRVDQESGALAFAGDNLTQENSKRETFMMWYKKYSSIWSHFAGLSVALAVLCVVFSVVFKVLAGIDEETHLTPESLDPGLWNEVQYLLHLKIISPIRNRVRTAINQTHSKRVDLEIVTPSTISVTPERYAPPTVTGRAETVTHPLRSSTVTPRQSVTESVTQMRYGAENKGRNSELPTHVTPVTGVGVTHFKGSAAPKPKTVTPPEAVVVELEPTVTGKKPHKIEKTVTDAPAKVIMVTPTKAVIIGPNGEKETVTLQQVQSRKRSNKGNIDKRKTKEAKANAKRLYEFYKDLEKDIKSAK